MNDIGINVGYRILKYYLWQQFFFRFQVKKEKEKLSYHKLSRTLKEFEEEKPTLQQKHLFECDFTIFDLETTGFFRRSGMKSSRSERLRLRKVKFNGKTRSIRSSIPFKRFRGIRSDLQV